MAPIKKRSRIKKSNFAIKATKTAGAKYPITDLAHARNALSRGSQYATPKEKRAIARKIKEKFPGFAKKSPTVQKWLK